MGKGRDMDNKAASLGLLKAFEATFMEDLIPGILHNFANPLNGIMGRAQLLQRRLTDTLAKLERQYPEAAVTFHDSHKRLVSDVASICQESDRFYNMFQDVSGKFYAMASMGAAERINLSQLLAGELRFADYYLDFKHEIKKEIVLEESLPDVTGISGHYSLCFWSLFRQAMNRMRSLPEKTLYVTTAHDDRHVVVKIRYSGYPLTSEEKRIIAAIQSDDDPEMAEALAASSSYYLGLYLLYKLGAEIDFAYDGTCEETLIKILY